MWGRRRHDFDDHCAGPASSAVDTRDLRRSERGRIAKFANNFDDSALAALRCYFWRGEKIDTFLLVQRANDELKLWIGEQAGNTENPGRDRTHAAGREQQRVDRICTDGQVTAAIARSDRAASTDRLAGTKDGRWCVANRIVAPW